MCMKLQTTQNRLTVLTPRLGFNIKADTEDCVPEKSSVAKESRGLLCDEMAGERHVASGVCRQRARLVYVLLLTVGVSGQQLTDNVTDSVTDSVTDDYCQNFLVRLTWWHKSMEGIYSRMEAAYQCDRRVVYEQQEGDNFVFYVDVNGWHGWMIGDSMCRNKGYLSIADSASYLDNLTAVWEEYNSMEWLYNQRLQLLCIDYYQPFFKNKTSDSSTDDPPTPGPAHFPDPVNTYPSVTVTGSCESTVDSVRILMHVVIPVACAVIGILIIIITVFFCIALRQRKQNKDTVVRYDSRQEVLSAPEVFDEVEAPPNDCVVAPPPPAPRPQPPSYDP